MVKRVLMIAFHFPPIRISSGVHRTLTFSSYLLDHGWQPIVLSVKPKAYSQVGDDQLSEIADEVIVKRTLALDTARHLAVRGKYPGILALPDRWVSWIMSAVPVGLYLVRKYRPEVIWTTYPIATAHLIGLVLQRATKLPWVADFRDSMTEESYPHEPKQRKTFLWIERHTIRSCARAVFTTPGTLSMYSERYSDLPESRWAIIENGYDEASFAKAESRITTDVQRTNGPYVLVHSGLLYPSERDPRAFFAALAELLRSNDISSEVLKIVLRGTGYDGYYQQMIKEYGIEDLVYVGAPLSYENALTEMLTADALLLFQAANCNHQIPAKLYEYLRARKPILALTDPAGDTARTLLQAGIDTVVTLSSKEAIKLELLHFMELLHLGQPPVATDEVISKHTRYERTIQLSKILNGVV